VSNSDAAELASKIDVLTMVIAALVEPNLPLSERAPLLSRLGLDRSQIARVCNTTPEIVSVRLAESKRRGRTASKKRHSARRSNDGTDG
jgi:hypothetical protein